VSKFEEKVEYFSSMSQKSLKILSDLLYLDSSIKISITEEETAQL
jgi:hypothetical protein